MHRSKKSYMIGYWYVFFGKMSIQFLDCLFFSYGVMDSLYILYINSLWDMWFANIFSCSVGCLSILLMVSSENLK